MLHSHNMHDSPRLSEFVDWQEKGLEDDGNRKNHLPYPFHGLFSACFFFHCTRSEAAAAMAQRLSPRSRSCWSPTSPSRRRRSPSPSRSCWSSRNLTMSSTPPGFGKQLETT